MEETVISSGLLEAEAFVGVTPKGRPFVSYSNWNELNKKFGLWLQKNGNEGMVSVVLIHSNPDYHLSVCDVEIPERNLRTKENDSWESVRRRIEDEMLGLMIGEGIWTLRLSAIFI